MHTQEAVGPGLDSESRVSKRRQRYKADELVELFEGLFSSRCAIRALPFSARGQEAEDRERATRFFERARSTPGQVRAVVATSAFGMGMDYSKVPTVLHFYPRSNLSEYWQQVGRSGRGFDIEQSWWAEALALYSHGDMTRAYFQSQAQALDGIINSFSIPAFNNLVAWEKPPGSGQVWLHSPTGRLTKFHRFPLRLRRP